MEVRRESIAPGIDVHLNDAHTFGTDAWLLGNFATLKPSEHVFDLGAGCGAVGAVLFSRMPAPLCLTAVELNAQAAELAKLTAGSAAISGRMEVCNSDIRQVRSLFSRECAGLVLANPPYFEAHRGGVSPNPDRRAARSDESCTLDDICQAASYLLRFGGRFALCQRPGNILAVADVMRKYTIEPKRAALASHSPNKKPFLLLCEGIKGAKPGLVFEPCIFLTHKADNSPI